ncbi:MAG TPA: MGMT family protein [Thermomicrobiales bacterium]|nr:MGMT family protein [Thermomicrobiales bacterium]
MPASPEFAAAVYAIVARIPPGRVTTYGRIARALGEPRAAREVGWALMNVPAESDLPCHRVVNREGRLTGGWAFGQPEIMRCLLADEGVPFVEAEQVDLERCVWDPGDDERERRQPALFPPA